MLVALERTSFVVRHIQHGVQAQCFAARHMHHLVDQKEQAVKRGDDQHKAAPSRAAKHLDAHLHERVRAQHADHH